MKLQLVCLLAIVTLILAGLTSCATDGTSPGMGITVSRDGNTVTYNPETGVAFRVEQDGNVIAYDPTTGVEVVIADGKTQVEIIPVPKPVVAPTK